MALAIPGFQATAARDGIRLAMLAGMPADPSCRPEFVTIPAPAGIDPAATDTDGVPWDPTAIPNMPVPTGQRVLCALGWPATVAAVENFGERQPAVVQVTLLDEEYALVKGFSYLNLWPAGVGTAPVRYMYRRVIEQATLDTLGVWILECTTEDTV